MTPNDRERTTLTRPMGLGSNMTTASLSSLISVCLSLCHSIRRPFAISHFFFFFFLDHPRAYARHLVFRISRSIHIIVVSLLLIHSGTVLCLVSFEIPVSRVSYDVFYALTGWFLGSCDFIESTYAHPTHAIEQLRCHHQQ